MKRENVQKEKSISWRKRSRKKKGLIKAELGNKGNMRKRAQKKGKKKRLRLNKEFK